MTFCEIVEEQWYTKAQTAASPATIGRNMTAQVYNLLSRLGMEVFMGSLGFRNLLQQPNIWTTQASKFDNMNPCSCELILEERVSATFLLGCVSSDVDGCCCITRMFGLFQGWTINNSRVSICEGKRDAACLGELISSHLALPTS